MSQSDADRRAAQKRFGAALIMAVGGLIATLCCGCALVFAAGFLSSGGGAGNLGGLVLLPAIFGGVPALVGAAVFWIGLRLYRETRSPRDVEKTFD